MDRSVSPPTLARALAAGLTLMLAACGQSQPERSFATDPNAAVTGQFVAGQTLSAPITSADVKDDTASFSILTLPPEAVRNGRVTEKQFLNGWRQSMSLDKAKEAGDWNDISLEIQSAPGTPGRGDLQVPKPSQEGIRREILTRFPGTAMRIVNRPMANALGPFGLAIGAGAGGIRCAYAWQWVENLPGATRGEKSVPFFNSGEIAGSIRMRLCRKGVTADEIAMWYEQLGVSQQNLARVADAMRRNMAVQGIDGQGAAPGLGLGAVVSGAPAGGGRVTASVDSLESSLIGSEVDAPPAPRASGAKRAPRRSAKRTAPVSEPAAEPEAQAPAPAAPAPAPVPVAPSDGRRYLGPVSDGGGGGQYSASAAPSGGAGFGPTINGLPAQALRGPRF